MRLLVSFCLFLVNASVSFAQSSMNVSQNSVSVSVPKTSEEKKKFTLVTSLSTATNMESSNSTEDVTKTEILVNPTIRISPVSSVSAKFSGEIDHSTHNNSKILNTVLLLARDPIALSQDDSLNLALQSILPTDKSSRETDSLRFGAGFLTGLTHKMALFGKESSATYTLNGLKNSHKYDRNAERKANISHRLRHVVGLDISLTQKVTLEIAGYYQVGWTYENVVKERYESSQSLVYQMSESFAVSLDHTTNGDLYRSGGNESNVEIYNARASEVGVTLKGNF